MYRKFGNSSLPRRRNRFGRPTHYSGYNRFKRFENSHHFGTATSQSKLDGADVNLFIKKAKEVLPEEVWIPRHRFNDFAVSPILQQNITNRGYIDPTPIQDQAIEPILQGRDLIGIANTGTGKTAAFLIPLIDKVARNRSERVLIITPTRELAGQINSELKEFSAGMGIYSSIVIGGANIRRQISDLQRRPSVVIGTPGRLKDLIEKKALYLQDFKTFVLDEVDMMVDIGFIADVRFFISLLPRERQSLFFSATVPPKVQELLSSFVIDPVTISVKQQETAEGIDQDIVRVVDRSKKVDQLHDLLNQEVCEKVLIFGRTKYGIERLSRQLEERGFRVGSIHGNKNQSQRQKALRSFKQNEIKILLATDVAARGLDIDDVSHVINYDLPETYDDYIHRIGRTGRAGNRGVALTFVD